MIDSPAASATADSGTGSRVAEWLENQPSAAGSASAVGRGHVSLSPNLDAWHSEPFTLLRTYGVHRSGSGGLWRRCRRTRRAPAAPTPSATARTARVRVRVKVSVRLAPKMSLPWTPARVHLRRKAAKLYLRQRYTGWCPNDSNAHGCARRTLAPAPPTAPPRRCTPPRPWRPPAPAARPARRGAAAAPAAARPPTCCARGSSSCSPLHLG